MSKVSRAGYTMGMLMRRPFRRACMALGLTYDEDKGFLDSYYVVHGEESNINRLDEWLQTVKAEREER